MSQTTNMLPVGRSVSVIYADDLREEVGGKISIIGVYPVKMVFPSFPAVLPKLAIFLTATCSVEAPFKKLEVQVHKGEELIFQKSLTDEELHQLASAPAIQDTTELRAIEANFLILHGPVQITERCFIRPTVVTEDGAMHTKMLIIESAQDAAASNGK